MLLCTKNHFIKSLRSVLAGDEGSGTLEERRVTGEAMCQRIKDYATDESGLQPGPCVVSWSASKAAKEDDEVEEKGTFTTMVDGKPPKPGQRVVYVDGGFDLFSSGHIEFLRQVVQAEEALGRKNGWYDEESIQKRTSETGEDYGPAFVVAGVHDDEVINRWKGVNYPIMNIFERGLCVLQCRVSHLIYLRIQRIFPNKDYITYTNPVHLHNNLLRPLHAHSFLSTRSPLRPALRGLPRAYVFHAAYIRPLLRGQRARHLSGGQGA